MRKILIADDERDIREFLRIKFENRGFECIMASDGSMAVRMAKHSLPSMIIMDVRMPKMDGLKALSELQQDSVTRHIPVIVYTAQDPDFIARKGSKALDKVDFIMKPFDSNLLADIVEKRLSREP